MERSQHSYNSAVNVCLYNLVKSVKCNQPCSEGHEAENLISNNTSKRNKGFLVERFIKPPITLTFEFTCKIDLRYIYIQSNVGAQKTSGIELSIQSNVSDEQYETVSSGVLKGNLKGFIFHRYSENVRTKLKYGEDFYFHPFKSSRNLSVVKCARLKIFKTEGSSVPALGKVEFWGIPLKPLPDVEKSKNLTETHWPQPKVLKVKLDSERLVSSQNKCSHSIEVPEDFLDPITCDIMCQPVTLPSGKVIDISTLDSYEKAESKWGRIPSDPFTGIPFTNSSKPIVASDLKVRIDKFLFDNSNNPEFHQIPRTVGKSLVYSQRGALKPSASNLVTNKGPVSTNRLTKDTSFTNGSISYCENNVFVKRRKFEEKNRNQDCSTSSQSSIISKNKCSIDINSTNPAVPSSKKPTAISFQERMEKSLELSLKSTLSRLPSFTADIEQNNQMSLVECNVCKLCDNLFSIPCSHFVCRTCLVNSRTKGPLSCAVCKASYKSHDVHKVHISK